MSRPSAKRLPATLLLLTGLAGACTGSEARDRRPDVVLIVVDTLRADRCSSYGYPRPTTPRIDRLAAEGARFADATAQSSWTLPSMVSLLTGRYLTDYRDFPAADAPLLAEAFAAAGYRTVGVVANVLLRGEAGFARGFDHYDARPGEQPPGVDLVRARTSAEVEAALWGPLDAALASAGEAARPPLLLYVHLFEPHAPYAGDPALDRELAPDAAPGVRPDGWQAAELAAYGPPPPDGRADWSRELTELVRRRGLHDQDVRLADDGVGRILDGLAARGVLEHAVVAVASDHGECLWERLGPMPEERLRREPPERFFYQEHGAYLYEEAVRTPLVLWGAGVPAGVVVDTPVENVDLFPTLLELSDVPSRGELHGRSLVPLLSGARPARWKERVHAHVLYSTSIRDLATGEKLIAPTEHGLRAGARLEVFRLGEDPLERRPIDDAATEARLRAALDAWRARYPTESTLGKKPSAAEAKALGDLGYTEAHTGG